MERTDKKTIISISVIAAIAITVAVFLSYVLSSGAWFFDKHDKKDSINRIEFDAEVRLNDILIEEFEDTYNLLTSTTLNKYTPRDDSAGITGYAGDKFFNEQVDVMEITIKNIGTERIRPKIEIVFSDDDAYHAAKQTVPFYGAPDAPKTTSALRAALILKSRAELDALSGNDLDAYGNPDYYSMIVNPSYFSMEDYYEEEIIKTDWKGNVLTEEEAEEYESEGNIVVDKTVDKVNAVTKRTILNLRNKRISDQLWQSTVIEPFTTPETVYKCTLVTWIDYNALMDMTEDDGEGEEVAKFDPENPIGTTVHSYTYKIIIEAVDYFNVSI